MFDVSVYYCWSCDAHRKAELAGSEQAQCPCCGEPLADEDRLASPTRSLLLPVAPLSPLRDQLAMPA
jgi:hypothetical protein